MCERNVKRAYYYHVLVGILQLFVRGQLQQFEQRFEIMNYMDDLHCSEFAERERAVEAFLTALVTL